jgi:hypothetical protein
MSKGNPQKDNFHKAIFLLTKLDILLELYLAFILSVPKQPNNITTKILKGSCEAELPKAANTHPLKG